MLVEADLLLIAENIGGKIPVTYGVEPSIVQINTAAPVFPGLVSQLTRENRSKKEGYLTWV
jgi:hypothetical protein